MHAESDTRLDMPEAFALGWDISWLNLIGSANRPSGSGNQSEKAQGDPYDRLPGVASLSRDRRTEIRLEGFDARLARLTAVLVASSVQVPRTKPLHEAYRSGHQRAYKRAVHDLRL